MACCVDLCDRPNCCTAFDALQGSSIVMCSLRLLFSTRLSACFNRNLSLWFSAGISYQWNSSWGGIRYYCYELLATLKGFALLDIDRICSVFRSAFIHEFSFGISNNPLLAASHFCNVGYSSKTIDQFIQRITRKLAAQQRHSARLCTLECSCTLGNIVLTLSSNLFFFWIRLCILFVL